MDGDSVQGLRGWACLACTLRPGGGRAIADASAAPTWKPTPSGHLTESGQDSSGQGLASSTRLLTGA